MHSRPIVITAMKKSLLPLCLIVAIALGSVVLLSWTGGSYAADTQRAPLEEPQDIPEGAQIAYFAGGCFWCTEEIFQQVPGVIPVTSGYMGGSEPSPTYDQ